MGLNDVMETRFDWSNELAAVQINSRDKGIVTRRKSRYIRTQIANHGQEEFL